MALSTSTSPNSLSAGNRRRGCGHGCGRCPDYGVWPGFRFDRDAPGLGTGRWADSSGDEPGLALALKLVKALPTTMTLAVLQRTGPGAPTSACHLFWAGDSRAYVVEPEAGVRQLTTDDLRSGGDAMRNLTDDSVMSNCIAADAEFHINHREVELKAPFLLLCATDGCFAYVRSPMHFEHLLLSTLQEARDMAAWQQAWRRR